MFINSYNWLLVMLARNGKQQIVHSFKDGRRKEIKLSELNIGLLDLESKLVMCQSFLVLNHMSNFQNIRNFANLLLSL